MKKNEILQAMQRISELKKRVKSLKDERFIISIKLNNEIKSLEYNLKKDLLIISKRKRLKIIISTIIFFIFLFFIGYNSNFNSVIIDDSAPINIDSLLAASTL